MLTLSTTPEQEQVLQDEAQRLGLSAEQLLLNYIAERLPKTQPSATDDETAALDELVGCLADVPSIVPSQRRLKEEEMALEEEKFLRRFRGYQAS